MSQERDLLRDSLVAIERLRARVRQLDERAREPIAIVGAGCRFPGADDPGALWRLLHERRDLVRDVPADRWDPSRYSDPHSDETGKAIPQKAGFLDGLDLFDAHFFGISAREAASLDPQHRLLLETAQEAIENAGLPTNDLLRSRTGVFVGISTTEYQSMMLGRDLREVDIYAANGGALNTAAGRVSFVYGFEGPAMAIDTACSSSLVAVHLAVQSLRRGETDLALAAGVNVVLQPTGMVLFSQWGLMAPDGACKTFDDAADGFVRAEGCGTVALKRLSDALKSDDPILAVIRGTAVNSDGRSSGLTVPHGPSQEAVIRSALSDAGLAPADIDYIESHGTGTSLGDPIELEAIGTVMREGHDSNNPTVVGAVKPNIGHGEASAGMAGLLKIVTSLQNNEIPPNIHFETPSRRVDWSALPLTVPQAPVAWPPRNGRARRAGVSGFGFSGTNAHVIIEEAPSRREAAPGRGSPGLALLSARTSEALRALAARYAAHLAERPQTRLPDVLTTLATGRAHGQQRIAFPVHTMEALRHGLEAIAAGARPAASAESSLRAGEAPRIAFLFTGQGSQYAGMGRDLYEHEPVFRAAIDRCSEIAAELIDTDLRVLLFSEGPEAPDLSQTGYAQPALFAFEYALATLWRSFGLEPSLVAGHSVGEYVAACLAGVFSLEQGLTLIAKRGRLMQQLPSGGAMAAIFADEAAVDEALSGLEDRIAKAAVNGPAEIVVSGEGPVVAALIDRFRAKGVEARPLDVSHAFHSPLLEPMLDAFERTAADVAFSAPRVPLVSNVTGRLFAPGAVPDSAYWRRHAREAVRFADVLKTLEGQNIGVLVEIGPHPTLVGLAGRSDPSATRTGVGSLRRGRPDRTAMVEAIRDLHIAGVALNWTAIAEGWGGQRIALPPYPFQRERHWLPTSTHQPAPAGVHPLLGRRLDLAGRPDIVAWEADLDLDLHPWLGDHRVQSAAIVPATAYIEMAFAAARELGGTGTVVVHGFTNLKPLVLVEGAHHRVQTTLTAQPDGYGFGVYGRSADDETTNEWVKLAEAVLARRDAAPPDRAMTPDIRSLTDAADRMDRADFYARTEALGNEWGPMFQGLERVWRREHEALAEVTVRPELTRSAGRYCFHPAVSDACGHALVSLTSLALQQGAGGAFVGGGVDEIRFHRPPPTGRLWAHATLRSGEAPADGHLVVGDVHVYGEDGELVTETVGAKLWYFDKAAGAGPASPQILYDTVWHPRALDGSRSRGCGEGAWLILGHAQGIADAIADVCREAGRPCVVARMGAGFTLFGTSATLCSTSADDHAALLRAIGPTAAILDLRAIDGAEDDAAVGALHLLQAAQRIQNPGGARIWFATSGTQPVGQTPVTNAAGAALWGLGRTASVEQPDQFGGLLDLDPNTASGITAQFIVREVVEADSEDLVAFRGTQRHVARLARIAEPVGGPPFIPRTDATYLLSGGLGGIALAVAAWLVEVGARHLVLLGRTPLPPRTAWSSAEFDERTRRRIKAVQDLESGGARVEVATVDVAEEGAVAALLRERRARGEPPVAAAFHAAGMLAFVPLSEETPADLAAMMNVKLRGALLLEAALAEEPLDHFVLFSSTSAVLRSPLLGAYAGANAAIDALACRRAGQGLPALSINWGTWGEAGMAVDQAARRDMITGIDALTTAVALDALGRLMAQGVARATVMPVDWAAFSAAYSLVTADPFLSDLAGMTTLGSTRPAARLSAADLLESPEESRRDLLTTYLRSEAARALGLPPDRLDLNEPLSGMGFDSLMAVQIKSRLEANLGVVLPMMRVLSGPSVEEIADIVLAGLPSAAAATEAWVREAEPGEWEEGSL